jgi:hypothetical protein
LNRSWVTAMSRSSRGVRGTTTMPPMIDSGG